MASILKVDTITGVTTAGSIAITGEGNSTTTNLQQGLAKAWAQQDGAAATARDSFNVAGVTDEGTGDASYTLTSAMSDSNFSVTALTGYKAATSIEIAHLRELTASKVRIRNSNSSSYRDPDTYCSTVQGDLA
jgi:hypothetical protein